MGVLEGCARGRSVIFEDEHIPQPEVFSQIQNPIAIGPKEVLHALLRQRREGPFMVRRLNDDFMRAHTVHAVIESHAFPAEVPFNLKGRKLVRNNPDVPARTVR